jgi:2-C-methyl-D-erythritol 4-phosphate cytidylyltransferase
MIFGAILAGGTGSRMNMSTCPKQFLPLGDKPVLMHTLEKFLACPRFDKVYIGVHPDWVDYCRELVAPWQNRVEIVSGGKDRNGTIFNVIAALEEEYGRSDDHVIVTHDAVRPFLTQRILEENIDGALLHGAVDTVVPASDTIVVSEDGAVISDIPVRSRMYQGQTPQSFRINLLKRLYESLTDEEKNILTDACKICVVRDHPVHLVMGEVTNMKITTKGDYEVAKALAGVVD